MSHKYHHRYTLHRRSEGERVHPKVKTTEQVLQQVFQVVDVTALVTALYDQVYSILRPYLSNPRRSVWQRYVYEQASDGERREAYWRSAHPVPVPRGVSRCGRLRSASGS